MTDRPLGLVQRAVERISSQGSEGGPAYARTSTIAVGSESTVPSPQASADAPPLAEPMRAAPDFPGSPNTRLLRLQPAILSTFALAWLAIVLVAGGAFVMLSGERKSISSSPPPAAAAPQAPPSTIAADTPGAARQDDDLVALGNSRLWSGDIATARLYFERAAEAGNAHAAFLVGETYDVPTLAKLGVRGMRGDTEEAARWYRRARDLGDAEAAEHLAGPSASK